MANKRVAVVGDRTTTGGVIITGADSFFGDGKPVARQGDYATCPKCNKVGTIIQGLNTFNIHGKGAALDGYLIACGCPTGTHRIIACHSMIFADDTPQPAPSVRASSVASGTSTPASLSQDIAPQSSQAIRSNTPAVVEPVFAKSCLRESGCTDAGTSAEPIDNFGQMAFYQATALAVSAGTRSVTPEAGAIAVRYLGGAPSRLFTGRLFTAPNPVTVGLIGIFYSSGLNSGEQDYLDQKKLESLAAQGGSAPTRVRFQWVKDSTTGKMTVKGYHTDSGKVPVKMMRFNASSGFYEFWEAGAQGPTILWTPDNPGFIAPENTGNDDVFRPPPTITVLPEPTATGGYTETLPIPEDKNFRDYILVHPTGAFQPVYIYLSKPPVKLLEVELYGDFEGRSRGGEYEADHMPSSAAVKAYLRRVKPKLNSDVINAKAKQVASMIVPKDVHRKISETYGGRNSPTQIDYDSRELKSALDRNFEAVKKVLKDDYGVTETELEQAREKMHRINREQGWY
ncbi:S-type pyocin domain-containing protein [Pragia fontium]|uniref:S-type pyocin domain-containing protein n=1 Tax=Pragia fontium TaxID=82985 RepID=UPI000F6F9C89|nr:S-type pyocin domain-containing protein [Pragia fontium]VEJ53575.1 Pyocin large subunit [Pragia fontium]